MSEKLCGSPIFVINFVQMCLESRIKSFGFKLNELWSEKRTNVKTAKTVKSVSDEMYWLSKPL